MGQIAVGRFYANRSLPTMIETKRLSPEVLEFRIPYKHGETFEFFLASDIHLDNPKCDRKLFARHLDEAKAKGAPSLFFGDVFCLMQGSRDRRADKGSIRIGHLKGAYFDTVFEEGANFLSRWGDNIYMMSDGNHETAIMKHNEVDPLRNVTRLMREKGSKVEHMSYQGFIFIKFYQQNPDGSQGKVRQTTLAFHHGVWGGVVTKGTLGGSRYFNIFPTANIVLNGHNHERTVVTHTCYMPNAVGTVEITDRLHLQSGTYKEEFGKFGGFAVEKIAMPKSLGGLWLKLRPRDKGGVAISCEFAT